MKKFFKTALWVFLALIVLGSFYFLYQNSKPKVDIYQNVQPSTETIERTTILTGKIEPRDEIAIKPQISGIISEVLVEPGDQVNSGDVIARIKVVPDASALSNAQNRLTVARIDLDNCETLFARDSTLYSRRVISREEFETSQRNLRKAIEEVASSADALAIVERGVSRYNASASNTEVRATISGLILDVPIKIGSSVIQANTMNDGTTVATIADMNNLIFKGSVDETEVGQLSVGTPMSISIGAMPNLNLNATIEYISPKSTNSSGANTFEIKAALDLADATGLRAGYSANATVALNRAENVLAVPEAVVEFSGDSTYVYVLTDGNSTPAVYDRRSIKTGISDGINIEVISGIDSTVMLRGDKIMM